MVAAFGLFYCPRQHPLTAGRSSSALVMTPAEVVEATSMAEGEEASLLVEAVEPR